MKKKVFIGISIVFVILIIFGSFTYAKDVNDLGLGNLDNYKPGEISGYNQVAQKAGGVLTVIQVIGMVLSVIVLIVLGIKYLLGSVEQKAEFKHTMIPYLIGVAILFTGSFLPAFIYNLTNDVMK